MAKNNIVDLEAFRKGKGSKAKKPSGIDASVVDISEKRQEAIASERREVARTVLSHFIGVFLVIPDSGLQPVALYDVSETGLAFDLPTEFGKYSIGETVTMRMYLSHDTYFSYGARIANAREIPGEGVNRHGAIFKKGDDSYKTLYFFVKFLEQVSLVSRRDTGDRLLGRID